MSESVSEFFDAQEVLLSASSSENEVRFLNVAFPTVSDCEFGLKKVGLWTFVLFFNIMLRYANCSKAKNVLQAILVPIY